MTKEEIIRMAYEAGLVGKPSENSTEFLEAFAALVASAERERIKQANAPEIERINAYIKEALAQPEQEPVGWAEHGVINWLADKQFNHTSFLYDTPAQSTWVGLTDGEVDKMILLMGFPPDWITENAIVKNIVRNLEAKLKEKNT